MCPRLPHGEPQFAGDESRKRVFFAITATGLEFLPATRNSETIGKGMRGGDTGGSIFRDDFRIACTGGSCASQ